MALTFPTGWLTGMAGVTGVGTLLDTPPSDRWSIDPPTVLGRVSSIL